jgi:hypothetical protein
VVAKQEATVEVASTAAQSFDSEVIVMATQAPLSGVRSASLSAESLVVAAQAPGPTSDPNVP